MTQESIYKFPSLHQYIIAATLFDKYHKLKHISMNL